MVALQVIGVAYLIGAIVWFIAYRGDASGALRNMETLQNGWSAHVGGRPEQWATKALRCNFRSRLAPIWVGVLLFWATAGLRENRQKRLKRLKVATEMVGTK